MLLYKYHIHEHLYFLEKYVLVCRVLLYWESNKSDLDLKQKEQIEIDVGEASGL